MNTLQLNTTDLWFQAFISAVNDFFTTKKNNQSKEQKFLGKIELFVENAKKNQNLLNNFDWKTPTKDDLIALEKEALLFLKKQTAFKQQIKQLAQQNSKTNLKKAFNQLLAAEKKVSLAIDDFLDELDFLLDDEAQTLLDKIHNGNLEDFSPYQHL
jgi:hypothetical protein